MLNTVILMGRICADLELKHTQNDIPVTSFTLAVDRGYAKPGTEKQTDFITVVAWRNTAEFLCKYFSKGNLVAVQGSLQTRKYTDKQGNNRVSCEVVADKASFTGEKQDSANKSGSYTVEYEEVENGDDLPF